MNYTYVIKHHKIPVVLEKETGFYARIDQVNWQLATSVKSKNDFELETSKEAHLRIKDWLKINHPELLI
jgi:predicted urease superfamily metal-dependent hydrolase